MPELPSPSNLWDTLSRLRGSSPLVHNITNYVVMNYTANALLALGASPVMAHAEDEVEDMVNIASSLVINIGTLDDPWVKSMKKAWKKAKSKNIPIILDPVGSGATPFRTNTCRELLSIGGDKIFIRGNASEISSLLDDKTKTKGVDSNLSSDSVHEVGKELSKKYKATVVVSGVSDLIINDDKIFICQNGSALMTKVTGMGCTASSFLGAFASATDNPMLAGLSCMAVMGISGELAYAKSKEPGSFGIEFLNSVYSLDQDNFTKLLRISS
jgi:hydroxyethylthiazole kinase